MLKRFNFVKSKLFLAFFLNVVSLHVYAVDCRDVGNIIKMFLEGHLSIHKLDEQMSERTLKNYIKMWDPGKVYFLQSDIDEIMKNKSNLSSMILDRKDCKIIDEFFSTYMQRNEEYTKLIHTLIDSKHDFKKDEFISFDRKTEVFAKDKNELQERWRKRIKFQHMQLLNDVKNEAEIRSKLHKRYDLRLKHDKKLNSNDIYETFINSFSTALDPHSEYYTAAQLEEFNIHTRLYLEGIGALLRSEDGITTIHGLVPGGSAQKSGLVKTGDKIVAVAQENEKAPVDVIDMDLKDVVALVRGPRGSKVRLTIRRAQKDFVVTLVREKVDLPDQAAKSRIYEVKPLSKDKKELKNYKIGFIELPSFYRDFEARSARKKDFKSSARDVEQELIKLEKEKVDLVIVDIRSNGGGALDEAVDLSGLFLGEGPIVQQVRKSKNKPEVHSSERSAVYKGPLIVMINQQSASSSEIMAGAIKDYNRGLLVGGLHTFGKGTVQIIDKLDNKLGAIKVTISKFYTPSGASTQNKGVLSDINTPGVTDLYEIGERFYDYALEWDQVAPLKYKDFKMVAPYLAELKGLSEIRLKNNPDFKKVFQAMKEYNEKGKDQNKISLKVDNKTKANKEKDEDDDVVDFSKKEPKLSDDLHLQETLFIAGDYIRLIRGEVPVSMSLPKLEKEKEEKKRLEAEKKNKQQKGLGNSKKQTTAIKKNETKN